MPRHRHRSHNPQPIAQPGGYPSAAERARIIERRRDLSMALVHLLVQEVPPADPRYQQLIREYGAREVSRSLESYSQSARDHDNLLDKPYSYRKYRQAFAVFGGQRLYLTREQHSNLQFEFVKLFAARTMRTAPPYPPPGPRETELYELLLIEEDYWRDITPPAVPPRPASFPAPHLDYPAELKPLFEAGPAPISAQTALLANPPAGWQKHVSELTRIIAAPDLLNGWPGDTSAWAPLHALNVLGPLRAAETAPLLLKLMDNPNDWLSDLLPATWQRVGPAVIPFLWAIIDQPSYSEEKRAQAAFGLAKLAQPKAPAGNSVMGSPIQLLKPSERDSIVKGLIQRLETLGKDTRSLNAYIIHTLRTLKAAQTEPVIRQMFKKGWVNERIVSEDEIS